MSVSCPASRYYAHCIYYTLLEDNKANNRSLFQGYNSAYHKHGQWKVPHGLAEPLGRLPCVWGMEVNGSWGLFCEVEMLDRQKRWSYCSWGLAQILRRLPASVQPSLQGDPECPVE